MSERADAWDELQAALPPRWACGQPSDTRSEASGCSTATTRRDNRFGAVLFEREELLVHATQVIDGALVAF